MTDRKGDWMQTFLGRQFWPLDPRADEIDIVDIAHSLSMQCRYAGHTRRFYSVAEHSVLVARWLLLQSESADVALWGLLHDASEAYLVDVPRPVKPSLIGYKEAETRVMAAVCEKFGLPLDEPAIVKEADSRILIDERVALMNPCEVDWPEDERGPLGVHVFGDVPVTARKSFLRLFMTLKTQRERRAQ